MKKKLLIVLLPAVLMIAGAFGVWANEQVAPQPGCANCAKMKVAEGNPSAAHDCANCPNRARMEQGAPCPNCPNAAKTVAPAAGAVGCDKCANSPVALQPAEPAKKGCCNKGNVKPE